MKEIARRLELARDTVRSALRSSRRSGGLLAEFPRRAGDGDRGADRLATKPDPAQGSGAGPAAGALARSAKYSVR